MSIYPTRINQSTPDELQISWSDGHQGRVTLKRLRDSCPCAGCAGETVLFRLYTPPPVDETTPGRYILKGAEPVGAYALQLTWGDGHDNGIYHWEYLRSLCECNECAARAPTR